MQMLNLIKKDILVVKKLTSYIMLIIIAIPIFIKVIAPSVPGMVSFVYMVVTSVLVMVFSISAEEEKYPKATSLLCAVPYSRRDFIIAKYLLFIVIFVYCLVVITLINVFLNRGTFLSLNEILIGMLLGEIVFCVYLPVSIKYGMAKARIIFVAVILITAVGPTLVTSVLKISIDFSFVNSISNSILPLMLGAACIIVYIVSFICSNAIFANKEL